MYLTPVMGWKGLGCLAGAGSWDDFWISLPADEQGEYPGNDIFHAAID
jgi:hypothetical protein